MADALHELLSPQAEEQRDWPIWLWLVGGLLIVGVVVGVLVLMGGSDEPTEEDAATGASVPTSDLTVPTAATEESNASLGDPDAVVEDPEAVPAEPFVTLEGLQVKRAEYGPDPEFDTSNLGALQVLEPTTGIGLGDQSFFETSELTLEVSQRLSIGDTLDGHRIVAVAGTVSDPYLASFGAPGVCYHLANDEGGGASDCLSYDPPGTPTALFIGQAGLDQIGWGLLPDEASVAALTVNNVAMGWQRPLARTVVFSYAPQIGDQIELRVLSADGVELAAGDRSRPVEASGTYVEPITGYGDFIDLLLEDIDIRELSSLIVECMNDQGVAASIPPPEAPIGPRSIDLTDVPEDERAGADLAHARCRAGLNLPGPTPRSIEDQQADYEFLVTTHECLVDLGFSIQAATPFDEWLAAPSETRWDPILLVSMLHPSDAEQALKTCIEE